MEGMNTDTALTAKNSEVLIIRHCEEAGLLLFSADVAIQFEPTKLPLAASR
jgi:hypothetical protein